MSGNSSFLRHLWPINLPSISDQKILRILARLKNLIKFLNGESNFIGEGQRREDVFEF